MWNESCDISFKLHFKAEIELLVSSVKKKLLQFIAGQQHGNCFLVPQNHKCSVIVWWHSALKSVNYLIDLTQINYCAHIFICGIIIIELVNP
jgi:hypothetical protein